MLLQTLQLTKDFGKNKGVFDLTIDINASEIVGFLGPNGAGKSTTLGMLSGLIKPTQGKFKMFDKEVSYISVNKLMPQIGVLASDVAFDPNLKARQIFSRSADILGKNLKKTWEDLAKYLDLDLDKTFKSFSLGNKKKVGLIHSIMHRPKLLLMDEPTSGLDPLIQQKFQQLMMQMSQNGTGILLSSHALGEVESICNRIIMIKNGKTILQDTTKNIQDKALKVFTLPLLTRQIYANIQLLEGVVKIEARANSVKVWTSKRAPVLNLLHQNSITEFYVEKATLEEMFLQFYR